MTNIDVSKVSFFSNFPTLINYQKVSFSFNIPQYTQFFASGSPPTTFLVYEHQDSTAIDKANGIAQLLVGYTGATYYDGSGSTENAKYNVRGVAIDYLDDNALSSMQKNFSNASFGTFLTSPAHRSFVLNIFCWFDSGRLYTKVSLFYTRNFTTAVNETIKWNGGTITTEANISLPPY